MNIYLCAVEPESVVEVIPYTTKEAAKLFCEDVYRDDHFEGGDPEPTLVWRQSETDADVEFLYVNGRKTNTRVWRSDLYDESNKPVMVMQSPN